MMRSRLSPAVRSKKRCKVGLGTGGGCLGAGKGRAAEYGQNGEEARHTGGSNYKSNRCMVLGSLPLQRVSLGGCV
jgi:hypothetical protein